MLGSRERWIHGALWGEPRLTAQAVQTPWATQSQPVDLIRAPLARARSPALCISKDPLSGDRAHAPVFFYILLVKIKVHSKVLFIALS